MDAALWPELAVGEWQETRDTLQLWLQVVGKVRLSHSPLLNHWWNVPLYVNARGLTTSLMWTADGLGFEMRFDFVTHELWIETVSGRARSIALGPRSVASFYHEVIEKLTEIGIDPLVWPVPVEIPGAVAFESDDEESPYDAEKVERFWRLLSSIALVFNEFRVDFVGKASPVHVFWGALDIATTRFSGRGAPPHPGGAPNCGPHVMLEAYSHEVSSAGYWPGGSDEGSFYSYAYPEPEGFEKAEVSPAGARYDADLGEFVLPYSQVWTSDDPGSVVLEFLRTTYEAAADLGGWDRKSLERTAPEWTANGVARPGSRL